MAIKLGDISYHQQREPEAEYQIKNKGCYRYHDILDNVAEAIYTDERCRMKKYDTHQEYQLDLVES